MMRNNPKRKTRESVDTRSDRVTAHDYLKDESNIKKLQYPANSRVDQEIQRVTSVTMTYLSNRLNVVTPNLHRKNKELADLAVNSNKPYCQLMIAEDQLIKQNCSVSAAMNSFGYRGHNTLPRNYTHHFGHPLCKVTETKANHYIQIFKTPNHFIETLVPLL